MPDVVQNEEIVVTGTRLKPEDSGGGGGGMHYYASYSPSATLDLFSQVGGGEVAQVVQFDADGGDIVVRFPGIGTVICLLAADRARMQDQQFADFVKTMTEFSESREFVQSLEMASSLGLAEIPFHFDDKIHNTDGTTSPWNGPQHYERMSMTFDRAADGSITNFKAVLNINSTNVPGTDGVHDNWPNTQGETVPIDMSLMIMHSIRHIFYVGQPGMENQVRSDADKMHDDIYKTSGLVESNALSYLNSQTFIGSSLGDNAVGGTADDTMAGFSGGDSLNGGAGDDVVMGGAGMDILSGGTGSNSVMGGLDADVYVPTTGVTAEMITEMGGVDRLDLARISIDSVSLTRFGDTLLIAYYGANGYEEVQVSNQWLEGTKVEQFTFAEGTYAASYIESLASGPNGGVCYDGSNPVICGPFGLPVVLDLDGDGIELIEVRDSKARFDINADGERERIGWVGADDGILALDRDGNGRIDDFTEISFLQDFMGAGSDLEGLFAYDSDRDGFLTAADDRFSEFLVWRDANGNGHSEKNELYSLAQMGIASIDLERRNIDPLDVNDARNQILATSSFTTTDGRSFAVGDVALFSDIGDCGCHSQAMQGPVPVLATADGWAPA